MKRKLILFAILILTIGLAALKNLISFDNGTAALKLNFPKIQNSSVSPTKKIIPPQPIYEEIWVKTGDIINLNNGIKAEMQNVDSDHINLILYTGNSSTTLYYPKPSYLLSNRRASFAFDKPYFSISNNYVYYEGSRYTSRGEIEGKLMIYKNAQKFYEKCITDGRVNAKTCLLDIGPYGPVNNEYKKIKDGRFHVIYPKNPSGAKNVAQQILSYTPRCYNAIKDLFTVDQNISDFFIFLYKPDSESTSESPFAISDAIIIPYYDHMLEAMANATEDACGIRYTQLGHEMTHVFDFGTQNTPKLREGFADYISRKFTTFNFDLVCQEDGFITRMHSSHGDYDYPLVPYTEANSYERGQCFFQRLENIHGISKINNMLHHLGTTRNIESTGEDGYTGNINFFDDVIIPIFGETARTMAAEMNIDTTCDYSIPFTGFLCAGDVDR